MIHWFGARVLFSVTIICVIKCLESITLSQRLFDLSTWVILFIYLYLYIYYFVTLHRIFLSIIFNVFCKGHIHVQNYVNLHIIFLKCTRMDFMVSHLKSHHFFLISSMVQRSELPELGVLVSFCHSAYFLLLLIQLLRPFNKITLFNKTASTSLNFTLGEILSILCCSLHI